MPSTDRRSHFDRLRDPFDRRPLAREGLIAALAFGAFLLWTEVLRSAGLLAASAVDPLLTTSSPLWSLADNAIVASAVIVAGMACFAAGYVRLRGLSVGAIAPETGDLPLVAAAVLLPAAAVAAVYGAASATGTTLSALHGTSAAPETPLIYPVVITGIALSVGLPAYVLLAHVIVQRTLRRAADAGTAIGVTAVLIGFTGPTELIGSGLPMRTSVTTVLLAVAIALPVYAAESFDREWLPWLCGAPLALFAIGFVAEWAADVDGLAAGAYALTRVGVVALGACVYERTDSLLPPALTYAAFVVSIEAVVVGLEAGVPP